MPAKVLVLSAVAAVAVLVGTLAVLAHRSSRASREKDLQALNLHGEIATALRVVSRNRGEYGEDRNLITGLHRVLLNNPPDKQDWWRVSDYMALISRDTRYTAEFQEQALRLIAQINRVHFIEPLATRAEATIELQRIRGGNRGTPYRPKGSLVHLGASPESLKDEMPTRFLSSAISSASGVVWVDESRERVGSYRREDNPLPIVADAEGYQAVWSIWVVDVRSRVVTAQTRMDGPLPPARTKVLSLPGAGVVPGSVLGAKPCWRDVEAWLRDLPAK